MCLYSSLEEKEGNVSVIEQVLEQTELAGCTNLDGESEIMSLRLAASAGFVLV